MTYWNPVERYGVEAFAADLAAAGGAGVITPDLIPDEAGDVDRCHRRGRHRHRLPRRPVVHDRAHRPGRVGLTTGFVYAASTMGVTGARASVDGVAQGLVARVREATTGRSAWGWA